MNPNVAPTYFTPYEVVGTVPWTAHEGTGDLVLTLTTGGIVTIYNGNPYTLTGFTVRGAPPITPQIPSIQASPNTVRHGASSTITWTATDATKLTLIGKNSSGGTTYSMDMTGRTFASVTPTETTTYQLNAVDQCSPEVKSGPAEVQVVPKLTVTLSPTTVVTTPGSLGTTTANISQDNVQVSVACQPASSLQSCKVSGSPIPPGSVFNGGTNPVSVTVTAAAGDSPDQTFSNAATITATEAAPSVSATASLTLKTEFALGNLAMVNLVTSSQTIGTCTLTSQLEGGGAGIYNVSFKCPTLGTSNTNFTALPGAFGKEGVGATPNNKAILATYVGTNSGTGGKPGLIYEFFDLPLSLVSKNFGTSGFYDIPATGSSVTAPPIGIYVSPDSQIAMVVYFNTQASPALVYALYYTKQPASPLAPIGTFQNKISASVVGQGSGCTASQCVRVVADGATTNVNLN